MRSIGPPSIWTDKFYTFKRSKEPHLDCEAFLFHILYLMRNVQYIFKLLKTQVGDCSTLVLMGTCKCPSKLSKTTKSFEILGLHNLTRALQSTLFRNPGGYSERDRHSSRSSRSRTVLTLSNF